MRILRSLAIAVVVLALLGWGGSVYLLGREDVPEHSDYRVDLDALRELARSLPGSPPSRIRYERVAIASLPRGGIFAGEPFDPHVMVHGAYQIAYPDGSFVVVGAAMSKEMFETEMAQRGGEFWADARARVDLALESARVAVITHEHSDHLDGIVRHPAPEKITGQVRLNEEQLADPTVTSDLREAIAPLVYEETLAIAPGVVLLRARGHTPGSQIVFVRLASGEEWLLLGDVAWHMDQIEQLHYRPRLVTDFMLGEDRAAVLAQFRTLHELQKSDPIQLVVSHDREQHDALLRSGRLASGFE
jgi:glyoxylase-like metal-dependent hydrolase (beta-lactamase superfamily II)